MKYAKISKLDFLLNLLKGISNATWLYVSSASQHHYHHWNRHWKNFLFCLQKFFWKNRSFLFFPVLSISTTLLQIFISLRFLFIHQKASIGVLEKGYLNFRKDPSTGVLKNNCFENSCILLSKTSRVEFFLCILARLLETFPKSCLEQLFCREPFSTCFCKKEDVISVRLKAVI